MSSDSVHGSAAASANPIESAKTQRRRMHRILNDARRRRPLLKLRRRRDGGVAALTPIAAHEPVPVPYAPAHRDSQAPSGAADPAPYESASPILRSLRRTTG